MDAPADLVGRQRMHAIRAYSLVVLQVSTGIAGGDIIATAGVALPWESRLHVAANPIFMFSLARRRGLCVARRALGHHIGDARLSCGAAGCAQMQSTPLGYHGLALAVRLALAATKQIIRRIHHGNS